MSLSTYTSYLITTRDLNTSLNRIAAQSAVKRETEYYQTNIGSVASVEEFMKDYRLYSYAMKAHGLENMIPSKAFMKKVMESDLTDLSSFARKLTDKRYQAFAAAFNFAGETKMAQSDSQEKDLLASYEESISAEEKSINAESTYYGKTIEKITTAEELVRNKRLITYAMKAYDIYTDYYSKDKLIELLKSDLNDPASYASVEYVGRGNTLQAEIDDKRPYVYAIDERAMYIQSKEAAESILADPDGTLTDERRATAESQKALAETKIAELSDYLQSRFSAFTETDLADIRADYKDKIAENERLIGIINRSLAMKEQFSFNTDGTIVNASAQTSDQITALKETYLHTVSTAPSYSLYISDKAHYESVIANASHVNDLINDERVFNYIKKAYGISVQTASTLGSMLRSDPTNPDSAAAIMGFPDLPRLFNFNTDGKVKAGTKAQTSDEITFINANGTEIKAKPLEEINNLYKKNYLYAYQDEIDLAMENYEKRIDAVHSVGDLFEKNQDYWRDHATTKAEVTVYNDKPELWEVALEAHGLDASSFSQTKIKRILTSDLSDKRSYANSLKDDKIIAFAKSFNFDAKGEYEVPLQAQNELVVNDLATDYKSMMTRFLTEKEAKTAAEKADKEVEYYKEQIGRIKTVKELLADERLVSVMLRSRGLDPEEIEITDLKKMFLSDLSNPESFANQQDNKVFVELVASFNFDSEGTLTDGKDVLGSVQQRGDVLETVNLYTLQALEEQQGNSSEGVRLALYFQRKAPEITSPYDFLSDDALTQFLTTAFSLSSYFSNMEVDKQKAMVEKVIDVERLNDSKYITSLVQRYTAMFDASNSSASSVALSLLTG